MARRTVYNRTHSENGWPMVDQGSCTWIRVPGAEHVSLQIQNGQPLQILRAFAADYHAYVEPLRDPDSACWTATNSVGSSNHLSGTGMDLNWQGADGKTFRLGITKERAFPGQQSRAVDELLAFYEGIIFNGGQWSIRDFMHWQLNGNTYNAARTQDFINRKIRPDGFSTYKRGGGTTQPTANAVDVLARATGISHAKATEILPMISDMLVMSECTTVPRIAMSLAQNGHESAGFNATEEYQNGDETTDRWKYKGRTWIQLTWRSAYEGFGKWCHARGLVADPNVFVNNPRSLAELKWAGLGAAYYWTTTVRSTRKYPTLNQASDARDLLTATQIINGGTNGLADRQARYNRALALGDQLLTLTSSEPLDDLEAALMSTELSASRSIYRTSDQKTMSARDALFGADACAHMNWIEQKALSGDPWAIDLVGKLATGNLPAASDPWAVARAQHIIRTIQDAIEETK